MCSSRPCFKAWVAIGKDAEVREVRAWLHRIVHNVAVSNLRKAPSDSIQLDETAGGVGADQEVEQRFAAREALAGLAALPDLQRQVMLSTALEGRSHEEIADAFGLSHGAVRGLIYRPARPARRRGRADSRAGDQLGSPSAAQRPSRRLRGRGRRRVGGARWTDRQGRTGGHGGVAMAAG